MERRIKRGKAKSGKETTATHWLSFKSSHLVNFYNGVNKRRVYMEMAPWLAIWPGVFLTITVYSLNMFGDAMRDLLDPRQRGGMLSREDRRYREVTAPQGGNVKEASLPG